MSHLGVIAATGESRSGGGAPSIAERLATNAPAAKLPSPGGTGRAALGHPDPGPARPCPAAGDTRVDRVVIVLLVSGQAHRVAPSPFFRFTGAMGSRNMSFLCMSRWAICSGA